MRIAVVGGTDCFVGIGTSSPAYTLDINGSIRSTLNIIGQNSCYLGRAPPSTLITALNAQGTYIGWNGALSSNGTVISNGETDFVNCRGTGGGGFNFYNIANGAGTSFRPENLIVSFTQNGQVIATSFSASGEVRVNTALQLNNKLITLWDETPSDPNNTDFYGFGIISASIRYQVPGSGFHKFYAGTSVLLEISTTWTTTGNPIRITNTNISTTTGTGALLVSGGAGIVGNLNIGGQVKITNATASTTTGTGALIVSGGAGIGGQVNALSFNAQSDYRIKTDVVPLSELSYNVDQLKPIKYTNTKLEKEDMGFIAHEVQDIFPFLVSGVKDGKEKQSLNYNGFIALLVKEIQDLKKENVDLKSRLDTIEKRLM
jgi:hypothetical protein